MGGHFGAAPHNQPVIIADDLLEFVCGDFGEDINIKLGFEELLVLIDTLPNGAREVFNMAVFDAFSHEEIAEALGIPAGTSRSLLSRARKQLQQHILKLQSHELARI